MQQEYEDEVVGKITVLEEWPELEKPAIKKPKEKQGRVAPAYYAMKTVLGLLRDIGIAFLVIIIVTQFITPTVVFERSMENTLHPDDYVFLNRQVYHFGDIAFGDVIVFESILFDAKGNPKNLVKRVVGLPGDTIEIKDNKVYRNGERLDEPYTKDGVTTGEMVPITVPHGAYFVLGDNRAVSKDSRSIAVGLVPESRLRGKVVFRMFPISTIGRIG